MLVELARYSLKNGSKKGGWHHAVGTKLKSEVVVSVSCGIIAPSRSVTEEA